jgi:predicted PurR-regulated permease PerM
VLIAVMFDPLVVWLTRHRVRRPLGISVVAVLLFGSLLLFFTFIVPAMSRQLTDLLEQLPQITKRIAAAFPPAAPLLQNVQRPPKNVLLSGSLTAGKFALEGLAAVIFVLVVAIYLLVEGRRAFEWLVSFAPANYRKRVRQTGHEMSDVVLAYVRGNVITAITCAVYVFVVLTAMNIPQALLLAVIAFVFDFVPVLGTIVMTGPAALLALMVSPLRALLVVAAYLFYHLVENYVIIPRVYGKEMRLSTLTVLVAIAIGGTLQGIIGVVLALPTAAAYRIVERIWLQEHLQPDTVARHEAIEESS